LSNIGLVIGWKFDDMSGMSTREGEIIQFPADVPGVNYDENGLPTQADQDLWTVEYDAYIAATQHLRDREAAMSELLPQTVSISAMLAQAKVDRDVGGKTLEPSLEEAVNIYSQILTDNPEPS